MTHFRNVCFTINNPTIEDHCLLWAIDMSYLIVGMERGGKENTPHLQGYIELTKLYRLKALKKFLPRAHIEARRGTALQASDYCKKEGDWFSWGTISRQGTRSDLDANREMALTEGMGAVSSYGNMQQIRVAEKFLQYNEPARDWKPTVVWFWGTTGTGKSRMAREIAENQHRIFTKNTANQWWDGYDAHEHLIIDDFRDSWWGITEMLRILDRYECQLQVKGGHRQLRARTIVVTSAKHPKDCYAGTGEAIDQLLRRVDIIEHIQKSVTEVSVTEVGEGNTKGFPEIITDDVIDDICHYFDI